MTLRDRLNRVIFESDTPAGRAFDVALLWPIVLSVAVVVMDSVAEARAVAGPFLRTAERAFTILFTIEFLLRLYAAQPNRSKFKTI